MESPIPQQAMYNSFKFESEDSDNKLESAGGIEGNNGSHSRAQHYSQVNRSRDFSEQFRSYINNENSKLTKSLVVKPSCMVSQLYSLRDDKQVLYS